MAAVAPPVGRGASESAAGAIHVVPARVAGVASPPDQPPPQRRPSVDAAMATAVRSALAEKREIGDEAVWTLSSAKPGNGVEQLRDGNVDTFWQSDGPQPHLVNIQFHRKVRVKEIAIYTDFKLDESYTPARLSIRAGTGLHDLREVQQVTLQEPSGWVMIPLAPSGGGARGGKLGAAAKGVRAFLFQIAVLSSHQNGRDTHVRQVRIYGARPPETKGLNTRLPRFSSVEFNQVSTIR